MRGPTILLHSSPYGFRGSAPHPCGGGARRPLWHRARRSRRHSPRQHARLLLGARPLLGALLLLGAPSLLAAQAGAPDDPKKLMEQVFDRGTWQDMRGTITLTMQNARGDKKVRQIQMWSKTNKADENSMLMRFVKPADVRGTGFLTIEHKGADDDRRLFMPALRRVNRISASGSGGNFMSSDFTYYDIGSPDLVDWSYRFAGEETRAGVSCRLVEGLPATAKVAKDTGYTKVVWCIDPKRLMVVGADYYEKGGRKFKVMEVLKVEEVKGVPFATHMRVQDIHTKHQSEMLFEDLETDTGIEDKTFTERNLKKWTR